jgi:hypothetical protein
MLSNVGKRVPDYNGVTYQSRVAYSCGVFLTNRFIVVVNGDVVLTYKFIALSTLRDVRTYNHPALSATLHVFFAGNLNVLSGGTVI